MTDVSAPTIRTATEADLPALCVFYKQICDAQKDSPYSPDWHWGEYPSEQSLRESLTNATVVIAVTGEQGGTILGAGILTHGEDPDYAGIVWDTPAPDDKITVLHLFAVSPSARGTGLAQKMMRSFFTISRDNGFSVMHLDVMKGNVPAEKMCVKRGFRFVSETTLHYKDIGDTVAHMYEKPLASGNF